MKLVTYYYLDMRYYWDNQQLKYVERDYDGPRGFTSLFKPIIDKYWDPNGTVQAFIKPYMWHIQPHNMPPTKEEIDACALVYQGAALCAQCTMYEGSEGETFTGYWNTLDNVNDLREVWDQLQDWGIKRDLPVIASITLALQRDG